MYLGQIVFKFLVKSLNLMGMKKARVKKKKRRNGET